ncbi:MAG: YncE family protein, partial [Chitinophagaceae bacterium]
MSRVYDRPFASSPPAAVSCSAKSDTTDYTHGYIGDLVLNSDGDKLYAVDQIGFRLVVIDVTSKKLISSSRTGRYPFGIALSPDEKSVYVANVGMYEYKLIRIADSTAVADKSKALGFPAYSYGSRESAEGLKNDTINIPGLGDPLSPDAFSIWAINVSDATKPHVMAKVKTGFQIGDKMEEVPAVGGSSPNSIVANDQYVFVSNGNNDCISVIDLKSNKLLNNIKLNPESRLKGLRGIIPFGLALSPDKKTLYVAEAGINAVAVIDAVNLKVLGHFPTGWFPSKIAVSKSGDKIYVANAKGYGSGPNGGINFVRAAEGSNIGRLMKGTVSISDKPGLSTLAAHSKKVIENNFLIRNATDT